MKLEIGKKYRTRDGREVIIEGLSTRKGWANGRLDGELRSWNLDGTHPFEEDLNLMEIASVNLEVGKTYMTRDGRRVTIDEHDGSPDGKHPFWGRVSGDYLHKRCWNSDGIRTYPEDSDLNIVSVVPPDVTVTVSPGVTVEIVYA